MCYACMHNARAHLQTVLQRALLDHHDAILILIGVIATTPLLNVLQDFEVVIAFLWQRNRGEGRERERDITIVVNVCLCVCACVCMYVCMCVCACMCIYMFVCVCVCVYVYACMCVCKY
jgi:hypothetical protein